MPRPRSRVGMARELVKIQGAEGTVNHDPYMHGMYNGMELILATIEDREPVFADAPEQWIDDPSNYCERPHVEAKEPGLRVKAYLKWVRVKERMHPFFGHIWVQTYDDKGELTPFFCGMCEAPRDE